MDNNTKQIQIPVEVHNYLDSLLQDADIHTIDNDMREAMVQELYERLDKYIALKMVEELSDEKLQEFMKLNEERKPKEEIEKFLQEYVPNARDIFTKAFIEFRDIYLNNVAVVRQQEQA